MGDIKVSVIVPIYKVEQFIERCVVSLMEQTLDEVEYIFVDDASPDNSIDILQSVIERYPEKKDNCKIIRHLKNQGLPSARNTGLSNASGDYIFHCDSDDYVEPTMLEDMYHTAVGSNADIVWCDWYLTYSRSERYMCQPSLTESFEAVKAMLRGKMKFNVWNKLVRCALYVENDISFPSGYGMGEDMTTIMLFVHAKNVIYLPKAYYHYVKLNSGAFSQTYSNQHLVELKYNVGRIEHYMKEHYGDKLDKEIALLKLDVKFPFLISDNVEKYKLWKEWYPEANTYIARESSPSLRSFLLQWFAKFNQFWVIAIYYKIVYKFIYNIIYK